MKDIVFAWEVKSFLTLKVLVIFPSGMFGTDSGKRGKKSKGKGEGEDNGKYF